ncbi:MAG: 3-oxoadipate enol-lactonase [Bryobacteraceae bacterium]|jgi:3-oxoadipate enol-lactonase/4-carboxymuconolactone decarboxylase
MPFAVSEGCRIYYRLEGAPNGPLLVLAHSLGTDHGMWSPQMPALLRRFRVLRLDLRGHGASDAPAGDYTIAQLGRDVLAVADAAGVARFAYCGLSLGGMIGQWLGANAGDRIERMVLANTSPRMADPGLFEVRRAAVLERGMSAIEEPVMQRFFSARVLSSGSAAVESIRTALLATSPVGYAGCCAAVRDMDQRPTLAGIQVPVLVIAGDQDLSTPWTGHGDVLAGGIPGARAVRLAAAHLSNVERPSSFTAALFDFLLPKGSDDTLEAGFAVRRSVLGDAHVDDAVARTTEFTREFQELITRYAWGAVWTKPGLDPGVRRLLVLAITAALGRWEEFRLHLRTGLAAELEMADLKEVLLTIAVYAGVPAANTGFHAASEEANADRLI